MFHVKHLRTDIGRLEILVDELSRLEQSLCYRASSRFSHTDALQNTCNCGDIYSEIFFQKDVCFT